MTKTLNSLPISSFLEPGEPDLYLDRPQIDQYLEKAVRKPIVTVTAGAGYGKSHSVYSFLNNMHSNTQVVWVQLTDRDNSGDRFWEDFTAAVKPTYPSAAEEISLLGFPATKRQFENYISIPSKIVAANPRRRIFVFDDVHVIHNKDVLTFLERTVGEIFHNVTNVLISRGEMPFSLMTYESKGLLSKVTQDDLRFTRDELAVYFKQQKLRTSEALQNFIYRDTEGWAFAVYLTVRGLQRNPGDYGQLPQAVRANINQLIESDVMSTVTPQIRKLLIKLSLIDEYPAGLVHELGGCKDCMRTIGSFVAFDAYADSYRIHHLFLDYLAGLQGELTEAEKLDVWERTAVWYMGHGKQTNALVYFEKARDWQGLLDTIYALPLIMPVRTARALLEILDRLDEGVFTSMPVFYPVKARILILLSRFDDAENLLRKIIARCEPDGRLNQNKIAARVMMTTYHGLAFIRFLKSTFDGDYGFVQWYERSHQYSDIAGFSFGPPASVHNVSNFGARVSSPKRGEVERYIAAIEQVVPHVSVTLKGCMQGAVEMTRAELAFYRGDFDAAEQFALQGLNAARPALQAEIEFRCLCMLLRIAIHRGNAKAVEDIFVQIDAQLEQDWFHSRFDYNDMVKGWFLIQTGRADDIAPWLRNDFEESDMNAITFGLEMMIKIMYHMAVREYPAALALLDTRVGVFGPWAFIYGRIDLKVDEAVIRYKMGDRDGAFRALEEGWKLAEPNGFWTSFIEFGRDMRALLTAAIEMPEGTVEIPRESLEKLRNGASAYAKRLAQLEKLYKPIASVHETSTITLSPREMKVLEGLSQGLTGEEIAHDCGISVNTVKSVIKRVYSKLGAMNKADAVRIATGMGLLEEKA